MPTARYWRLAQCEPYYSTGLELSEVALYSAGTRIDGSATLSCPTPPSSGTLENLRDSSFESTVSWDETYPLPPGFALVWDFGSAVSVDEVGVAGPSQSTFLHKFSLQYSSDGIVWSGNPVIRTKFIGSDAFFNSSSGVIPDLTPLRQNRRSDAVSISEYPVSPTTSVVSTGNAPHIDVQDGGSGRIVGTVKEKATPSNTPLRRKVWLLNYNDGRIVRETWSDELTGAYELTDIDMNRTYTVVSLDHTGQYRAVIADNLSPEKM